MIDSEYSAYKPLNSIQGAAPYEARPLVKGFTIDGETSKDLDDAIWIETWGNKGIIEVHIADPTEVIPKNSELEQEARRKIATRYLKKGNKPMLPRELSEESLSLFPGEIRPTITIKAEVGVRGEILSTQIFESQLMSIARLTYDKVESILQRKEQDYLYFPLKQAEIWSSILNEERSRMGAIGSIMKNGLFTDEEGRLIEGATKAQVIIAEYMVFANTIVAQWLQERNLAAVYRNHAPIASDKNGLRIHMNNTDISHEERSHYYHLLGRAKSSPQSTGHFALALEHYLHFTSPLRRLSDFINHRIVKAALQAKSHPYSLKELEIISERINNYAHQERERSKEHFKEKFREKVKEAENYLELNAKELFNLIVQGEAEEEPLTEAIKQRIEQNKLGDKEIVGVLFKCKFPTIKKLVLDALPEKDLTQILNVAQSMLEEVTVEFAEIPRQNQQDPHEVELKIKMGDHITTVQAQGQNKKLAKYNAAKLGLQEICS